MLLGNTMSARKTQAAMALTERSVDRTEIDQVMSFLRANWHPQHILGHDRDFLAWQFAPARCRGFEQAGLSVVGLWDQHKLAGMVGLIGCGFNQNGAVVDGAWLCNLIVLPDYRRAGGWMRLMSSVHRLPLGAVSVITFPRHRSALAALGYSIRDRLFRLCALLTKSRWRRSPRRSLARANTDRVLPNVKLGRDDARRTVDRFWRRFTGRVISALTGILATCSGAISIIRDFNMSSLPAPDGEISGAALPDRQVKDHPVRVMRLLELMAVDHAG
jgi:hypothetical protein